MTKLNELDLQSKTIDWLRFPLAVFVVFIHMNPKVNIQSIDYSNLNIRSWFDIIATLISTVVGNIAVPCFYMFSGYLFFNKLKEWNTTVYFSKMKTRLKSLVVPYILFNVVAIVLGIIFTLLKTDGSMNLFLGNLVNNWYKIFWNYTSWGQTTNIIGQPLLNYGPYLLPLWFLRDLILMVIISPIVYFFVKKMKLWGLFLCFFFYYTNIWFEIPGFSTRLFLTAFFFFSIGAYFSISKKNIVIALRKYQYIWLVIAIFTMLLSTYFRGTTYDKFCLPIFILSGVFSAVNLASFFIERGKLRLRDTLTKSSFFVYCTHILILGITSNVVGVIIGKISGYESTISLFAIYFLTPFVCVSTTLCIYLLMRRFTPKILGLFTGNR